MHYLRSSAYDIIMVLDDGLDLGAEVLRSCCPVLMSIRSAGHPAEVALAWFLMSSLARVGARSPGFKGKTRPQCRHLTRGIHLRSPSMVCMMGVSSTNILVERFFPHLSLCLLLTMGLLAQASLLVVMIRSLFISADDTTWLRRARCGTDGSWTSETDGRCCSIAARVPSNTLMRESACFLDSVAILSCVSLEPCMMCSWVLYARACISCGNTPAECCCCSSS